MHREIMDFLGWAKKKIGPSDHIRTLHVVEVGAYDMNGSPREVFGQHAVEYVGVDHRPGPGVNVVSLGHLYRRDRPFNLAVCCQVLEHDPYWPATVANLVWLVRQGGHVIVTCAGPGFVKHELDTSPGYDPNVSDPYYRNVSADEIRGVLESAARWVDLDVVVNTEHTRGHDTLVWARLTLPTDG